MVVYFYLPCGPLSAWRHHYFSFCFRKMSFTLQSTSPDINFTSPSRGKWKSSQWKIWEAVWPLHVGSGVQKVWCHSFGGWHAAAVQKGRSKPENSLPPWPVGYRNSECSINMLFSKPHMFFFSYAYLCFSMCPSWKGEHMQWIEATVLLSLAHFG